MRALTLTLALLLAALPATAQTIPSVPSDFPAPGTFCGPFQLCQPLTPVTRGARG